MADRADGKMSSRAPDPVGAYPHARAVGNLLFLSGIGPRRPGTDEIPGLVLDDAGNVVGRDIEAECMCRLSAMFTSSRMDSAFSISPFSLLNCSNACILNDPSRV